MNISKSTYNGPGVYFIRYRKDKNQREWDDKIYIGSSKHIKQRLLQHLSQLKSGIHAGAQMQSDFTADPDGKWWAGVIRKMEGATEKELRIAEAEEIDKYPKYRLYNTAPVWGFMRKEDAKEAEAFNKRYLRNQVIYNILDLLAFEERIIEKQANCSSDPKERTAEIAREALDDAIKYFIEHF